jgi:hypothetical protein
MFKRLGIDGIGGGSGLSSGIGDSGGATGPNGGMSVTGDDLAGSMDTGAGLPGGPMFDAPPSPDPTQGTGPQSPSLVQPGSAPPGDPSAPPAPVMGSSVPVGTGLPAVSDLNPSTAIAWRKLTIRRG